ncbi:hypothetical protein DIPPA_25910 [Diplonema papillatum]|nr:hypothetical protein DIPPA_25910 [Diplonema papillatum]
MPHESAAPSVAWQRPHLEKRLSAGHPARAQHAAVSRPAKHAPHPSNGDENSDHWSASAR